MSDSFGLRHFALVAALYLAHLLSPFAAQAQTGISFGGAKQDRKQPVTIDADQLDVEQSGNKAVFTGGSAYISHFSDLAVVCFGNYKLGSYEYHRLDPDARQFDSCCPFL